MVLVQQHALASHHLHQTFALAVVQHQTVERGIVRDLIEESQAVLVAHMELEVLCAADCAGVWLVCVEHGNYSLLVDCLVDEERRGVDLAFALEHRAGLVKQQQVACRDLVLRASHTRTCTNVLST